MIGKMNKRITFQNDIGIALDDYGEKTVTWSDVYTCWASIEPLTGKDLYLSQQQFPDVTGKITMRYYAVKPEYRVKFESRYFKILSVVSVKEMDNMMEIRYQ